MTFKSPDFAKETSTTTGTGNFTVLGARAPGQTLTVAGLGVGDTFDYGISHQTSNEWEVGRGTMLTATTFSRSPTASSNAGGLVNFTGGTKSVDVVLPSVRIGQLLGPLAVGATTLGRGSLSFSNLNGVSWGLSTDSNGGTITASVNAAAQTSLSFSNANGLSFGIAGSTLTASVDAVRLISLVDPGAGTNGISNFAAVSLATSRLHFQFMASTLNDKFSYMNVQFRASSDGTLAAMATQLYLAGTTFAKAQNLSFQDANGVSFGFNAVTNTFAGFGVIPGITATFEPRLGLISANAVSSVASATRLVFSNSNGITFGISTAPGAATVTASVGAGGAAGSISAGTTTVALGLVAFSDSNNLVFGLNASTVTARAFFTVSATNTSATVSVLNFGSALNHTFGLSTDGAGGGTVTMSVYAIKFVNLTDFGASTASLSSFTVTSFGNQTMRVPMLATSLSTAFSAANVAFAFTGNTMVAAAHQSYIDGAQTVPAQAISFSNANGLTLSLGTSNVVGVGRIAQLFGSYTVPTLTSLSFSNANGVTFGIVGSTLTASVSPGGGGDVSVGLVSGGGATAGSVSRFVFDNAFNVNWLVVSGPGIATVQASATTVTLSGFDPLPGALVVDNAYGQNSLAVHPVWFPNVQFDRFAMPLRLSNGSSTSIVATGSITFRLGLYTRNVSTLSLLHSMSGTTTFGVSSSNNSSLYAGLRYISLPWTTTVSEGQYWYGVLSSTTFSSNNLVIRNGMVSQSVSDFMGLMGASNASLQLKLGNGFFSTTTGALPSSVAFSQLQAGSNNANVSAAIRAPIFFFQSGTA